MPKPDADTIIEDARKLKDDRFKARDRMLVSRHAERFNETVIEVPTAYAKTAHQHNSSIIEDEGRQVGTLVHATPVPHLPPPEPEDQPATTEAEKFLMAWWDETEMAYGPIWWQQTLAQVHDNIAWEYCGWRKVPYKGQPQPPDTSDMNEGEELAATADWGIKNERFKRDAGVKAYCERRYVPTNTAYAVGNIFDPDRFYEIKQVPERDLLTAYGITKNPDGSFSKATEDPQTAPAGYPQNNRSGNTSGTETMVNVVEYWDRDWCMIVAETTHTKWLGLRQVREGFLLAEWEHGWGRVPYFCRPAFITDQTAEAHRFAGPLDGVYTEMPEHKKLRTMSHSVAYQTAFSPLQVLSEKESDLILDDSSKPLTFIDLEPGKALQLAPGQKIATIPQSPEVANFYHEVQASQQRIEHYSLSSVAKGVSPGADTANAALSNLHRFQLSTLDPMAQQAAREASAIFRFVLERIQEMKERVYVYDNQTNAYLSLAADDIPSTNVQAKVTPDQGQFQLLIEKHAAELRQLGLITLEEMYSMWGKENPEELVLDLKAEKLADSLDPVINQQITADLGMLDAIKQMMQANAQQGDARAAVPPLMDRIQQMNQQGTTGAGKGSGGLPRTEGVRSPAIQTTTQPVGPAGGP